LAQQRHAPDQNQCRDCQSAHGVGLPSVLDKLQLNQHGGDKHQDAPHHVGEQMEHRGSDVEPGTAFSRAWCVTVALATRVN
jgi:hypothetical protein